MRCRLHETLATAGKPSRGGWSTGVDSGAVAANAGILLVDADDNQDDVPFMRTSL